MSDSVIRLKRSGRFSTRQRRPPAIFVLRLGTHRCRRGGHPRRPGDRQQGAGVRQRRERADAQHLVAELVGRFEGERRRWRNRVDRRFLGRPASETTMATNAVHAADRRDRLPWRHRVRDLDERTDRPMSRLALAAAKARGMITIAMTDRDGGRMGADADIHVNVAEISTPRVQEVHRTIMHAMCALIDRDVRAESLS